MCAIDMPSRKNSKVQVFIIQKTIQVTHYVYHS